MSKSSSNDDINIAYLDKLTEAVVDMTVKLDKISSSYGSNGQLEQTIRKLAQEVNNGSMSLKQMLKEASATQKNIRSVEYGLEDTTKYNKTVNMFLKLLEERMGDSKIDEVLVEKITTAFENLDVSAILESEKIEQRGGKGAPLKNTLDNEKLGRVNEDLARRIGLSLDTTTDKLITFFQEQEKKREKKTRGFVDDLIEGLEKSKWVGGALQDTFRLIGLLGANWLSKFGQLGRILGGAFYVAMATAGPLLVKLLLQGIGKLFTSLPRMLGNLGKGVWNNALKTSVRAGGPLGDFATAGAGQKLAAGGRLAGAGLAAGALGIGAFFAGRESYRSFKQGDKVGGSAFGVGAAGLGVAAIAAIVAGIAAPVTLIAAAVGGIAVGVGAIWKNREKILEHYKKNKDFYDKVIAFMDFVFPVFGALRRVIMWWEEHFGESTNVEDAYGNTNSGAQKVANALGLQDNEAVQTVAGAGINRAGGVIGVEKMDRMTASKVAQEYFKLYPEQAGRMYEQVGSKYASLGSFTTDWAIRNSKGEAQKAILHAGASEELQGLWDFLINEKGVNANRIELLRYTSGRKTAGDPKLKLKSSHKGRGLNSHENIAAMVTDLAEGGQWTENEWETYLPWIQEYLAKLGYNARYEGYRANGEFYIGKEFQRGLTNRHLHVDMLPGYENMAPLGVESNIAESKARAQRQSIDLVDMSKQLDPASYGHYEADIKRGLSEEQARKNLKGEMEAIGFYYDDDKKLWMKKKGGGIFGLGADTREGIVIKDASGNYKFEKMSTQMEGLAAGASNGR